MRVGGIKVVNSLYFIVPDIASLIKIFMAECCASNLIKYSFLSDSITHMTYLSFLFWVKLEFLIKKTYQIRFQWDNFFFLPHICLKFSDFTKLVPICYFFRRMREIIIETSHEWNEDRATVAVQKWSDYLFKKKKKMSRSFMETPCIFFFFSQYYLFRSCIFPKAFSVTYSKVLGLFFL